MVLFFCMGPPSSLDDGTKFLPSAGEGVFLNHLRHLRTLKEGGFLCYVSLVVHVFFEPRLESETRYQWCKAGDLAQLLPNLHILVL